MPDNKANPGPEDGKFISLEQDHEVAYWTTELNCTKDQLEVAVGAVGHSASRVREYLAG